MAAPPFVPLEQIVQGSQNNLFKAGCCIRTIQGHAPCRSSHLWAFLAASPQIEAGTGLANWHLVDLLAKKNFREVGNIGLQFNSSRNPGEPKRDVVRGSRLSAEPKELWRGLVGGTIRLRVVLETDGRRFITLEVASDVRGTALTWNEVLVLSMLLQGFAAKRIALELNSPASTVSLLERSALEKLGLRSRAELLRLF